MSQGSPRVTVRIPRGLLAEIQQVIDARNGRSPLPPWDLTGFLLQAIRDKLSHMKRSRRGRIRANATPDS